MKKKFIADLHIHSKYSLATSKLLVPEYLEYWSALKGIDLVGTGDCIHPAWLDELETKLEYSPNGFYKLKKEYKLNNSELPSINTDGIHFVLTTEISCIYRKRDKTRKVHNILILPNFDSARRLQKKLDKLGNIRADGRPILGIDSKHLLEIALEISRDIIFIPAHIWTPWFSVLGSKSGFDSIFECFEELTNYIFAVETGLSSDPLMNWHCSFLDDFALISNSDAHSPEKLGREANIFDCEFNYYDLYQSLKDHKSKDSGFLGTIEFYPEEGKYHLDGHRKCNICWQPEQTLEHNGICPSCGKEVTKGVLYRVNELADRKNISNLARQSYRSIIPLIELIAEIQQRPVGSKFVKAEYFKILQRLGTEFGALLEYDYETLKNVGGELLAEGIKRLRTNNVILIGGYDGEFGKIKVFRDSELQTKYNISLIGDNVETSEISNIIELPKIKNLKTKKAPQPKLIEKEKQEFYLTQEQERAINFEKGVCLVIAGPGAGKTFILTKRIENLIKFNIPADAILALTFCNQAAQEIRERLKDISTKVNVHTFHSFCYEILRKYHNLINRSKDFILIDEDLKLDILMKLAKSKKDSEKLTKKISDYKNGIIDDNIEFKKIFENYNNYLQTIDAIDIDDLIYYAVEIFKNTENIKAELNQKYKYLLIDEYQDINNKQYELIKLLIDNNNPNLFVIGDANQAIYGFRGANVRYIQEFLQDFPKAEIIKFRNSFRCSNIILKVAGQILGKEELLYGPDEGIKIVIQKCQSAGSEAEWIASQIERMIGGIRSFSFDSGITDGEEYKEIQGFKSFAVLCRTTAQFEQLKKSFMNHAIPFKIAGEQPIYLQAPFKDLILKIKLHFYNDKIKLLNNNDSELLSLLQSQKNIDEILDIEFNKLSDEIKKDFYFEFETIKEYGRGYKNDYPKFFKELYLNRFGVDLLNIQAERVNLLTMHSAKGLEFDAVFIAGCEDGIIPFNLYENYNSADLDEERRLFYVAITRAKRYLFLSYAESRKIYNRVFYLKRSRYLDNLEKKLLIYREEKSKKQRKAEDNQLTLNL